MNVEKIKEKIGDYAKDVRINISNVLTPEDAPGLSETQIYGTALASAYATKNSEFIQEVEAQLQNLLTPEDIQAAKSAASIMAMNNIYYRFVHLVSDPEYKTMPAALRMQVIAKPGVDKTDFELYSLAVSAINGCGMCIDAHVAQLVKAGLSKQGIQSSIRIAAVMNSVSQAMTIHQVEASSAVA